MGLKAGLSCPSLLQNLCAWLWKAVTRHKMTRSLPRELRWWRNGRLKGLRPGTITGRTRETRHDLGTDREGKGKHCSAGPERCSPRRKKNLCFLPLMSTLKVQKGSVLLLGSALLPGWECLASRCFGAVGLHSECELWALFLNYCVIGAYRPEIFCG